MGVGTLIIRAHTASHALPVESAEVVVSSLDGQVLYRLTTDANGNTERVSLYAPDRINTMDPENPGPFYGSYDVAVSRGGYVTSVVHDVQIYDTIDSTLPVGMLPLADGAPRGGLVSEYETPPPAVIYNSERHQEGPKIMPVVLQDVVIPDYITVHLGPPTSSARNIKVPFTDYIKNVASSEIFPTWPEAALESNMLAQITFALNRIYTEWYRSRGYAFDITNSTAYDQSFVENRNIFDSIGLIADRIFNRYVRRQGYKNPYFTQYCNGTTVTCPGLSQWGTVPLAGQGLTPLQILRRYYPSDIEIAEATSIESVQESYPGTALRQGSRGADVLRMQNYLNRIRADYPLIPRISSPDGVFGSGTAEAVRVFQRTFGLDADGVIGSSTWYKISYLYAAITRLAELDGEGERIGIGNAPPQSVLKLGSTGPDVIELQFILNYIAQFLPAVPFVIQDGVFDSVTQQAVREFQRMNGLGTDGTVGPATWNALYRFYRGIDENVPLPPQEPEAPDGAQPYPGVLLRYGSRGESVRRMQQYLDAIARVYPSVPRLTADGIFGRATQEAVTAFQRLYGLSPDGVVGPLTWDAIVSAYHSLPAQPSPDLPAYPGYLISIGSQGGYVQMIQQRLNALSSRYPSISPLSADGLFGRATQSAVTAFQRAAGLTPDGIVGQATWNRLMSEYASL